MEHAAIVELNTCPSLLRLLLRIWSGQLRRGSLESIDLTDQLSSPSSRVSLQARSRCREGAHGLVTPAPPFRPARYAPRSPLFQLITLFIPAVLDEAEVTEDEAMVERFVCSGEELSV